MTNAEFLEHYEKAVTQERETLARNRDEYATGFTGMTPAHFNLVREIANGKHIAPEMLLKKIRDFRNYLILLEGILLSSCEEREQGETEKSEREKQWTKMCADLDKHPWMPEL